MAKPDDCAICGSHVETTYLDVKGKGTLYGMECDEGHFIGCVFETKNRAVAAWNECQSFVLRYTEEAEED